MLRCIPGALNPGSPPQFTSPDDVTAWVRAVDWLVEASVAVVLHVDEDARLTCVATGHSRLQYLGPMAFDTIAGEAVECGASAVLAVDVRRRLPPRGVNNVDRNRHRQLRLRLAIHGVALLDTVVVSADGGLSVTGALAYPLGGDLSWLRVHLPRRPHDSDEEWNHLNASHYPPASAAIRGKVSQPMLWIAPDPGA